MLFSSGEKIKFCPNCKSSTSFVYKCDECGFIFCPKCPIPKAANESGIEDENGYAIFRFAEDQCPNCGNDEHKVLTKIKMS